MRPSPVSPDLRPPERTVADDERASWGMPSRRGFTLVELLVVLVLMSLLLGALPPRIGRLRDRMAVQGAREAAVGLVARARTRALSSGGSEVVAQEAPPRLLLRSPDGPTVALDLEREYGVDLEIRGPADRASLRFDALGIGRMASRTLRFRRGGAEVALTVSSYGRVRRR